MSQITKEQLAARFNCTVECVEQGYRDTYYMLLGIQAKIIQTGKKQRGYTLDHISQLVNKYKSLANIS